MSQAAYSRIGGWLFLPLAYLIVNLLGAGLTLLLFGRAIVPPQNLNEMVAHYPGIIPPLFFSAFASLAMCCFTVWLIRLFFQRSRRFPKRFLLWLLITVLLAIKAFAFDPIPDNIAVRNLGWTLLMTALLVPYIKRSQRVKGTFTER